MVLFKLYIHLQFLGTLIKKKNENRKYLLLSFSVKCQETGGTYQVFILSLILANATLLSNFQTIQKVLVL